MTILVFKIESSPISQIIYNYFKSKHYAVSLENSKTDGISFTIFISEHETRSRFLKDVNELFEKVLCSVGAPRIIQAFERQIRRYIPHCDFKDVTPKEKAARIAKEELISKEIDCLKLLTTTYQSLGKKFGLFQQNPDREKSIEQLFSRIMEIRKKDSYSMEEIIAVIKETMAKISHKNIFTSSRLKDCLNDYLKDFEKRAILVKIAEHEKFIQAENHFEKPLESLLSF